MMITNYSIYGTAPALPTTPSPAVQGDASASRKVEPSTPRAAVETASSEAATQARYFEDMINSAADLLLRSQMGTRRLAD